MKKIINGVAFLVLLYSLFQLVHKEYSDFLATQSYEKVQTTFNQSNDLEQKFQALKSLNDDYRFWIQVEGTNIDYPVVQTTDNDYYLTHNFNKKDSKSGAIFMDYRNQAHDQNLILYGHNMLNNTMFQALEQYKQQSFFKKNHRIILKDQTTQHTFEVFSVYVIKNQTDSLITNFETEEAAQEYLNHIIEKSIHKTNLDVSPNDQLLTLWTCSYEFKDAKTIIHARKINP